QCAIAGAGVSNLQLFRTKVSDDRVSRAVQGRTMNGMDPLAEADNAVLPILVYHGDRDVRVPIKDGRDFYNAVKNKVPAKFLGLKDMGHQLNLWTPDNHRDSLKAIEDFLENDCGPGGL
ncbi:MAG: prolyl oligopeptidase family serine peptidase, partial [Pseudomonadota bacterium]|nr:prolyl oligopeptidase family serine peptidase [Pseudomonadota bacterium]